MRFEFGEFTLDTDRQELNRNAAPIHLEPKAMQLLELLIERRPAVVSHEELCDHLWPDVVVLEVNLNNLVSNLRRALGDQGRQLIRTVHGRGYAFDGKVTAKTGDGMHASRVVVLLYGKIRFSLDAGENIIGRGGDATVIIDDSEVSRHHARIFAEARRVTIEDLGSKNGTCVNGRRIDGRVEINDGDELSLGPITLTVKVVLSAGETKTSRRD